MKTSALFVILLGAGSAFAETWTGTLVDANCKGKDLTTHARTCAISCAKGGYGIMLSDGKFVKFDESGNTKALSVLKASTKENDLKATVTGKMDGATIQVESVELQ